MHSNVKRAEKVFMGRVNEVVVVKHGELDDRHHLHVFEGTAQNLVRMLDLGDNLFVIGSSRNPVPLPREQVQQGNTSAE